MKNALLKFAGLFVERVPVDEQGRPLPRGATGAQGAQLQPGGSQGAPGGRGPVMPQPSPQHGQPPQQGQQSMSGMAGAPPGLFAPGVPMVGGMTPPNSVQQPGGPQGSQPGAPVGVALTVALRAWVPEDYATHLAPFGLHVIAAGGEVTSDQARSWGADALIVSAECLGQEVQLLHEPQMPTVFIAPQPVMLPDVPGLVQVQEPLRASDVAQAAREAVHAFSMGSGASPR